MCFVGRGNEFASDLIWSLSATPLDKSQRR
jgi:hypothetical protein